MKHLRSQYVGAPGLIALLLLVLSAGSAAQGTLTIDLGVPSPHSFDTIGGGTAGVNVILDGATNIVRTEPLVLTLVTTPTPPVTDSAQLQPRRLQLWVAGEDPTPLNFGFGNIYVDLFGGALAPVPLIDSFANIFHPTFGPSSLDTLTVPLTAELFHPSYAFPVPLVFQAVAEDTPGNGLLISGAIRVSLVDPETGFPPTITDINPKSLSGTGVLRPLGPESGGNVVTISGTNFLAQSDWILHPPFIVFGTQAATNVVILSNSTLQCTVPPVAFPTAPPLTAACLVPVFLLNSPYISPSGTPISAPLDYLYVTPQAPQINSFNIPTGDPEGLESRFILGSWFLESNILVRFTSVADPSFTTDQVTPPVAVLGAGDQISYITPPFCTGPVTVQVINCDEQVSNLATFTYDPKPPQFTSAAPTFSTAPELALLTTPVVVDTGSTLTISGADFITLNSTLNGSSTVNSALFHRTKVFIDGTEQCPPPAYPPGAWPLPLVPPDIAMTPVAITCPTINNDQFGPIRTGLGYKELRIDNPPCVNVGNVSPISVTIPEGVLVQDGSPPGLSEVFPAIGPNTGDTVICIRGTNFFKISAGTSTSMPDDYTQDFSPYEDINGDIMNLPPNVIQIPAVSFGGVFSPLVTLRDENTLEVVLPKLPGAPLGNVVVPVTVYNPDSQASTVPTMFTFVPPIVDPNSLLSSAVLDLDEAALLQIASGQAIPGTTPELPAVQFIVNPSPTIDQAHDVTSFGPTVRYEYCFLFNTRESATTARHFTFHTVNVPATITLPTQVTVPRLLFGSAQPGGINTETVPAGTQVRVIFKALGHIKASVSGTPSANGFVQVNANSEDSNFPLLLGSIRRMTLGAMVQLGGDALHFAEMEQGGAQSNPFRVQVDRVFASAGAGRGGRGGIDFPEGLTTIPAPNFGAGPNELAGGAGEEPTGRPDIVPGPLTQGGNGGGAVGNSPIAFFVGAGGGGGHTESGGGGVSGTSIGGAGGASYGTATASFVSPPAFGIPAYDRNIYGQSAVDMGLFAAEAALGTGLIGGGSGGGGGGGGSAIIVAQVCMGGRGGNGGGAFVALTNSIMTLTESGVILTYGDHGYPGILQFPVPNEPPFNNLCVGGEGGAGAGGTVLAFAIAHCEFRALGPSAGFACTGGGVAPAFTPARPQVDARGGIGGPAPGFFGGVVGLAGGSAGDGRVRFAVSELSPYIGDNPGGPVTFGFRSGLLAMFANPCALPGATLPAAMTAPFPGEAAQPLITPAPEGFGACSTPPTAVELSSYFGYPTP